MRPGGRRSGLDFSSIIDRMTRAWNALPVLLALLSGGAEAADKWLENRDAEELYAYIDVSGCPVGVDELRDFVSDQFVRSRIRLLTGWVPGEYITDQHEVEIPDSLHPGDYVLEVGLYDAGAPSMPRLQILGEEGQPEGDRVIFGPVAVR